jgi:16S rRNA U516 pseudouridylate synthase RsuA-like enzyme
MFYEIGYEVERLVRTRIGHLRLGDLPRGHWRPPHEKRTPRAPAVTQGFQPASAEGRAQNSVQFLA